MKILRKIALRLVISASRLGILNDRQTSILSHLAAIGRMPNLRRPRDLNEKIIWSQFNVDTTEWSRLSDKVLVREFVKSRGFGDLLVPTYGNFGNFDEIDFDTLPDKFVIKPNNGSGRALIVESKSGIDVAQMRRITSEWMNEHISNITGETHYQRIKPRLIVEELLPLKQGSLPIDYKFFCFNGEVDSCLVCTERDRKHFHSKYNLYNLHPWAVDERATVPNESGRILVSRPRCLEEMISVAAKLSEGFPFVRVDLYEENGRVYFGEMTFTPCAGRITYLTGETLLRLGDKVDYSKG